MHAVISQREICVNVISTNGNMLKMTVKPNCSIKYIKLKALRELYDENGIILDSLYRLINLTKFKQLSDDCNISDEDISENDELLLTEIRGCTSQFLGLQINLSEVPDVKIPVLNLNINDKMTSNTDLHKILITLAQASAKILACSTDAEYIYNTIKKKLEILCKPIYNPSLVEALITMGYPYKKILKALYLGKSNIIDALKWLAERKLEYQNDSDDSDEDFEIESDLYVEVDTNIASSRSSANTKEKSLKKAYIELCETENQKGKDLINILDLFLKIICRHRRLDFVSDEILMQSFIEMGFEIRDIKAALKITGNNGIYACDWLLGDKRRRLNMDEAFDSDDSIYKAIMKHPAIQASLIEPKFLDAFITLLEDPGILDTWSCDTEFMRVFSQLSGTYYIEKYGIHLIQLTTNLSNPINNVSEN